MLFELQLKRSIWSLVLPLIQQVIRKTPSPHILNRAAAKSYTGRPASPPVIIFLYADTATPVSLSELQLKSLGHSEKLLQAMNFLRNFVEAALMHHCYCVWAAISKVQLQKFAEGDFVQVTRNDFTTSKKLCPRRRRPHRGT